ncbi:MAG: hypothetical protein R3B74_10780 [Nitrospirales bacterium]|nr:hypothetical protein [Nitrospirales bacterium]
MKRWPWRPLFFILCISESLCLLVFSVATAAQSTVTFDNQSGEEALVKLVGPSPASLSIPDKTHRTVPVSPGRYTMMARYGDNPQRYRYTKGRILRSKPLKRIYGDTDHCDTLRLQLPSTP